MRGFGGLMRDWPGGRDAVGASSIGAGGTGGMVGVSKRDGDGQLAQGAEVVVGGEVGDVSFAEFIGEFVDEDVDG